MAVDNLARRKKPKQEHAKGIKRKRDAEDLDALHKRVAELDSNEPVKTFSDLPLSQPTRSGLEASHFKSLTDIQRKAVPLALQKRDILGAAKTGSGKTLSFLVPVLENLYRQRWTEFDGLGALILAPTRELAIQIFEVLRKIGRYHTFSAGLVIGGKSLEEEAVRINRMNILVCTPGRILQHMDQTAAFEIGNLQMLVLDEADRILDMGFQSTVDAIVEHLPQERQTLLFSATQTRKVSDLARLSLREPEYIAVHEEASSATPSTLQQHYVVTPLPAKLDTLWSFLRANLKSKILVFLSSGKQVRFVYESFRRLQPGIPLLHLLGAQKQTARLEITTKFASTRNACLFATDVVARGMDFPAVDWVMQLDAPEDASTYVHRVGRTARYESDGRAVLFLDPSEQSMLKRLEQRKIPIEQINIRQKKQQSIRDQLQNMCFKDPELKYLAQKAFVSYSKSIYLQKDKEVFKIQELPLEEFSASLGLPGAPRIKFQKGGDIKQLKNTSRQATTSNDYMNDDDEEAEGNADVAQEVTKDKVRTKYDRMFERRNQDRLSKHYTSLVDHEQEQGERSVDEDDGFMTVKRRLSDVSLDEMPHQNGTSQPRRVPVHGKEDLLVDSKRREKMLKSKKAMLKLKGKGNKLVFDDNGEAHELYELQDEDNFKQKGPAPSQRAKFVETEAARVKAADVADKQAVKEKRREKKEKRKAREAMERQSDDDRDDPEVQLPHSEELKDAGSSDPAPQRAKKWFEDDSDASSKRDRKSHRPDAIEDADTLEKLERLAEDVL